MGYEEEANMWTQALNHLAEGLMPEGTCRVDDADRRVLLEVAERLRDNLPYPSPLYAGQMLKPPAAVARLAYGLAQWLNPNNHALDGGRASSRMEQEGVKALARLFGWSSHLGHLTGGGTMANLEALWVASRLQPGAPILASTEAHYTHGRLCQVLGIPFESVPTDSRGGMDVEALRIRLEQAPVAMVVATPGTTGMGAVDPVDRIVELCRPRRVRVHADAAYGGFFRLVRERLSGSASQAFDALERVDSLVVDPHKHGLQPYGCGCVLFRDPNVGRFYRHESPYTYFTSSELHLGEISLECSRAGAAAVAWWATLRRYPLEPNGEFAEGLGNCLTAARRLWADLAALGFRVGSEPELDIVVFAPPSRSASETSMRSRRVFEQAARLGLHLALTRVPARMLAPGWGDLHWDEEEVTCLRSVLMKWDHVDHVDSMTHILGGILKET